MSLVALLGSLTGFVKVRFLPDKAITDNAVFRLHYRFTSAFFFASCVLITAFDLIGNPIDCLTDDAITRPEVVNTYCWITHTFTLPSYNTGKNGQHRAYPGVGPDTGEERRVHSYYQWVPFLLFFQGMLFYLPHWMWKNWENGKVRNMTDGYRGFTLLGCSGDERKKRSAGLAQYLYETVNTNQRFLGAYIFCEVLNFVNVLGNIFFIDRFLNGAFLTYGTRVIEFSNMDQEERSDPMIEVFPRLTKCTFMKYGASGTIQSQDALCLLAWNIFNEKIYIFLWFWLVLLSIISGLAVIYRLVECLSPALRQRLFRQLSASTKATSTALVTSDSVVRKLSLGDYFLVTLLGQNLDGFLFSDVIDELALTLNAKSHDSSAEMAPILTNFANVDR